MSMEKKDEIYGRVSREHDTLCKDFAACGSELKRMGAGFQELGSNLINHPEKALAINMVIFEKDSSEWRSLVDMYCDLGARKEAKKSELEGLR